MESLSCEAEDKQDVASLDQTNIAVNVEVLENMGVEGAIMEAVTAIPEDVMLQGNVGYYKGNTSEQVVTESSEEIEDESAAHSAEIEALLAIEAVVNQGIGNNGEDEDDQDALTTMVAVVNRAESQQSGRVTDRKPIIATRAEMQALLALAQGGGSIKTEENENQSNDVTDDDSQQQVAEFVEAEVIEALPGGIESAMEVIVLEGTVDENGCEYVIPAEWEAACTFEEGSIVPEVWQCDRCKTTIPYPEVYMVERHMRYHGDESGLKRHKCNACFYSTDNITHFRRHVLTHSGVRPHKCSECDKRFTTRAKLLLHAVIHSDVKPFVCEICGKRFPRLDGLKRHLLFHTKQRPYSCTFCGKAYTTCSNLQRHRVMHFQDRPYHCQLCHRRFNQSSHLKGHIERVHNKKLDDLPKEKPFACEVCGKRFPRSDGVRRHMVIHTGERNFTCADCGKAFTTSGNMKRHRSVHSAERPHQCPYCQQTFTQSPHLKGHMARVHGRYLDLEQYQPIEKFVACEVCGKRFPRLECVRRHMVVHTGERNYTCEECGKSFTTSGNMKRHRTVHSEERLHQRRTSKSV